MSNIYYPERLTSFYEVLKNKLSTSELFDLLCFLDDGMTDELLEMLSADCNGWFPDQFADYHKEIES